VEDAGDVADSVAGGCVLVEASAVGDDEESFEEQAPNVASEPAMSARPTAERQRYATIGSYGTPPDAGREFS
jgi:hypothetical protein